MPTAGRMDTPTLVNPALLSMSLSKAGHKLARNLCTYSARVFYTNNSKERTHNRRIIMKGAIYISFFLALFFSASIVSAAVDPAAAVVKVRKSCTENNVALDNCFGSMPALTDWMASTRRPNASNPLHVDIGPGTFQESVLITCDPVNNYTGYTAFEGAGNGQTILNALGPSESGFIVTSCTQLSFSHLMVKARSYGGVLWNGGGNSRWTDVTLIGKGRGWYESDCGSTRGSHYWFGSNLSGSVPFLNFGLAETYAATCDESWFFGSEITVSIPLNANPTDGAAVLARGNGIIHVYGSVLRTLVEGPPSGAGIPAAKALPGGEIHIHGTGIDGISNSGQNILALYASTDGTNVGFIHADGAAYNLKTTGTVTRIQNAGGHVHAPYTWRNHPEAPSITSENGADMAVVTNTQDGQPHLVIYSITCASKWFDTVTKACR
jgi:hypothetical protein